jgi:hypothetical protein
MRRQKSFLLTVIPTEEPQKDFCGQAKSVSTGNACTFSSMDEFRAWLMDELASDPPQPVRPDITSPRNMAAAIKS